MVVFKDGMASKNDYRKFIKDLSMTKSNFKGLLIEGKNLFNLEYKREIIDSKRKKILHKFFVENGKAISFSDIKF